MGSRIELHTELLQFSKNVYFQPPDNIRMSYPCIVYNKTGKSRQFGNNHSYLTKQGYQVQVIDSNPDSDTGDKIESYFEYASISQYFVIDSLNHTTLNLYY